MSHPLPRVAVRAVGGSLGIAVMMTLADASGHPLMMVPFATSIVLVMGAPESPPARPRCVVGGHLISAIVGVFCVGLLGDAMWVSALGVGIAIALMQAFDVFHPPAGISPLIITTAHATPIFVLSPAGAGALILVAFAFAYHRLSGERWPARWV
ncbi:MAG: HPP family protein [Alphaproteobacteria bacterium]|nr:HPP family protein [Alphaproteobacteria bacterium]